MKNMHIHEVVNSQISQMFYNEYLILDKGIHINIQLNTMLWHFARICLLYDSASSCLHSYILFSPALYICKNDEKKPTYQRFWHNWRFEFIFYEVFPY